MPRELARKLQNQTDFRPLHWLETENGERATSSFLTFLPSLDNAYHLEERSRKKRKKENERSFKLVH